MSIEDGLAAWSVGLPLGTPREIVEATIARQAMGASPRAARITSLRQTDRDRELERHFTDNGNEPEEAPADDLLDPSVHPVDLGPVLDGTAVQPMPDLLIRDDGRSLLYPGAINGVHGDSGAGKGWVACHLIAENARRGKRTMLLDLEDTAESITARLRLLGMEAHAIETWLLYVRPQVPFGTFEVEHYCELVRERDAAAVIVDSLGEAFALSGVNEDRDNEVGPWYRKVARPLADAGPAVVLVDHATKAADNPLHPSGSKRKRAAITGASYLAEAVKPFVKGEGGRLRLTCAKDRHGNYRRSQRVGDLVMTSNDRGVDLKLYAPTTTSETDTTVPTIIAAKAAVSAARKVGKPVSRNALEGLMELKASATVKRGGIDYATSAGALIETEGPRRARIVEYVRQLKADDV